jgi:hypothetical protein
MKLITEQFTKTFNSVKVSIDHEGQKPLDWENKKHLFSMILDDLNNGKKEGFYPYANFQCSVSWTLANLEVITE